MSFISNGRSSDSPLVEMIWQAQSVAPGTFISTAVSHWEMVITKYQGQTTLTVRGPETKASQRLSWKRVLLSPMPYSRQVMPINPTSPAPSSNLWAKHPVKSCK